MSYRSGFCTPGNDAASHARCTGGTNARPGGEWTDCSCSHHVVDTVALLTPAAFLVTDAEPETPEWFAARREGITGTDLPKILGLSKYGNALSVWMDKRGELEDEAGEAAMWGQILEDPVAQRWADLNRCTVERVGVLANEGERWKRVSLDRIVSTCPDGDGECPLEIKTRSAFKARDWRDGVPDDTLAQVQWSLGVTGYTHAHVAALIGGQRLTSFRVDRDDTVIHYLSEAAKPVWDAVLNGVPPEAHPDSEGVLLSLLDRLYSKRAGARDLDPGTAAELLDQYAAASDMERDAKAAKTRAKTALVQMLDDGEVGLIGEREVFTYRRPDPSTTLSAPMLRKLRADQPETFHALADEGYITTTTPSPRFTVKGDNS